MVLWSTTLYNMAAELRPSAGSRWLGTFVYEGKNELRKERIFLCFCFVFSVGPSYGLVDSLSPFSSNSCSPSWNKHSTPEEGNNWLLRGCLTLLTLSPRGSINSLLGCVSTSRASWYQHSLLSLVIPPLPPSGGLVFLSQSSLHLVCCKIFLQVLGSIPGSLLSF